MHISERTPSACVHFPLPKLIQEWHHPRDGDAWTKDGIRFDYHYVELIPRWVNDFGSTGGRLHHTAKRISRPSASHGRSHL